MYIKKAELRWDGEGKCQANLLHRVSGSEKKWVLWKICLCIYFFKYLYSIFIFYLLINISGLSVGNHIFIFQGKNSFSQESQLPYPNIFLLLHQREGNQSTALLHVFLKWPIHSIYFLKNVTLATKLWTGFKFCSITTLI